jgi:hypothetical protein
MKDGIEKPSVTSNNEWDIAIRFGYFYHSKRRVDAAYMLDGNSEIRRVYSEHKAAVFGDAAHSTIQ